MPFNATEDTGDDDLIEIRESIIQDTADNMDVMGSLVCEAEYMSPAHRGSLWHLIPKEGTISTAVDMGK
eukprot:6345912-Ditylum_brightwellii.AAC.1